MSQDLSYRALARQPGFPYLLLLCGGVWLFAGDRLIEATLLPDILADIGGAHLVSWGRTLFEAAAILTGVASAFLVRRWGIRTAFSACSFVFVIGCAASMLAPDMLTFQIGRFFQALAGSAFVSFSAIAVARMFPQPMIARAGSIVAIVWGFAAFSGPLVGGLFSTFADWRSAFLYLVIFGTLLTIAGYAFLGRHPQLASPLKVGRGERFPALRLLILLAAIMLLATAATATTVPGIILVLLAGFTGLAMFGWIDHHAGERRLLPFDIFNPMTRVGAAGATILFLSAAILAVSVFGPVLYVVLYDLLPIYVGFMMFSISLGWTIGEVIYSGTQTEREGRVILAGAVLIVLAALCFNLSIVTGWVPLIAVGFLLEGFGFGVSWALISRRAIADTEGPEKDRIAGSTHTLQRMGFAIAAALFGVAANRLGFDEAMSWATAYDIAFWLTLASVPLSLAGLLAAWQLVQRRHDMTMEGLARTVS